MSAPAVRFRQLAKNYGDVRALCGIDLEVERGEIFGFLGPNGAGKSTAIRIVLDLIRPTAGHATVYGFDCQADPVDARRHLGYLPSDPTFPAGLSANQVFTYSAALRGQAPDAAYLNGLIERLQLDPHRPVSELSRGNRQKVGLIQALVHRPAVAILDEPTTGLDPVVQQEVEAILRESAADGRTVFFSSHILAEVETICTRAAILREGSVVATLDLAAQQRLAPMLVDVAFHGEVPGKAFDGLPASIQLVAEANGSMRFEVHDSVDPLIKALARHEVESITAQKPTLEELFLTYYRPGERTGDTT